jgi:hypothetical protein
MGPTQQAVEANKAHFKPKKAIKKIDLDANLINWAIEFKSSPWLLIRKWRNPHALSFNVK